MPPSIRPAPTPRHSSRQSRPKSEAIPCNQLRLCNLPPYASRSDVILAVAKILHASPTNESKCSGLVNFDLEMTLRYSSAQNTGAALLVVPFPELGRRLQVAGLRIQGKWVKLEPLLDHIHPSRLEQLRRTPYRDPRAILAKEERTTKLKGDIRIGYIEIGALVRDGQRRIFSPEWGKSFDQQGCWLSFEESRNAFRIKYGDHSDIDS